MNTIASVGRLYKLKLAQPAAPPAAPEDPKTNPYLTYQWEDAAIKFAQYLLPTVEKFYQLSADKNSLYQYKGLYPQEWGKLWEGLNSTLKTVGEQYKSAQGIDKNNLTIKELFENAPVYVENVMKVYGRSISGGEYLPSDGTKNTAQSQHSFSETAKWIEGAVGTHIYWLDQMAEHKTSIAKSQNYSYYIDAAIDGIEYWQNHLEEMGTSAPEQFTICQSLIQQLNQLEKEFKVAEDAKEEAEEADPNVKTIKQQKSNQAWNYLAGLTSQALSLKEKLISFEIPSKAPSGKGQGSPGLEQRYKDIEGAARALLDSIKKVANAKLSSSREESWFKANEGWSANL